ncbi:hypothetical protein FN846DRAFT_399115 [Sphaerosporella brunnea]|uniref:Uncharacterized protein n=1 Tax=Sphaerosporella brunnea TaxID=1250544 RepID=A0A5J5EHP8_9PEZI|nr:hypothetical protein FN846DRAFT_399115 [Sphaerosporella brunnea]
MPLGFRSAPKWGDLSDTCASVQAETRRDGWVDGWMGWMEGRGSSAEQIFFFSFSARVHSHQLERQQDRARQMAGGFPEGSSLPMRRPLHRTQHHHSSRNHIHHSARVDYSWGRLFLGACVIFGWLAGWPACLWAGFSRVAAHDRDKHGRAANSQTTLIPSTDFKSTVKGDPPHGVYLHVHTHKCHSRSPSRANHQPLRIHFPAQDPPKHLPTALVPKYLARAAIDRYSAPLSLPLLFLCYGQPSRTRLSEISQTPPPASLSPKLL